MSNSVFPRFPDLSLASPGLAKGRAAEVVATQTLSDIPRGSEVHVVALALEEDLAAWLRAVGIGEGDTLTVLRRAAFGGPIHVRTSSGGEFALNRSLALSIHIRRVTEGGETTA